jgi:integrase
MAGKYPGVVRRGRGFQISFHHMGRRYRETLRLENTARAEREAFRILCLVQHQITMGTFKYEEVFPNSRSVEKLASGTGTIAQELTNWMRLNEYALAKSTRIDYQRRIDKHLIPIFGATDMKELTRAAILEWSNSVGLSAKSIRNTLCPLMATYSEAIRSGRIRSSPFVKLRLPKIATREPQPFTEDEVARILSELSGQVLNYFQFAFLSGLRTSELIALGVCRTLDMTFDRM